MRNLIDILKDNFVSESILDDIETNLEAGDAAIKNEVREFIANYYNWWGSKSELSISDKPNKDGLYEVSYKGTVEFINKIHDGNVSGLTNGLFIWKKVGKDFICTNDVQLNSLEGAPEVVLGKFDCRYCLGLKSLEGAPKQIGGDFICYGCGNFESLKGLPDKIAGDIDCHNCGNMKTLAGAPKEVGGEFNCSYGKSLRSLEGAPAKVGGDFLFNCCSNLTSLKGAPKEVGGDFIGAFNTKLTSLKYMPKKVAKYIDLRHRKTANNGLEEFTTSEILTLVPDCKGVMV